jgi:tryptophanyl-tRNA synthetase
VTKGCRTAGIGCLECKKIMIKHVIADLEPIQERRAAIESRPGYVEDILEEGNRVAAARAGETMNEVRTAVGL